MERYIFVSIRASISACFCCYSNGVGGFYPIFHGKDEIVAACCIFNCTEIGIIKIGIVQGFPFANILNSAFQAKPLNYDDFLHLAFRHIGKRNVIVLFLRYDCYFGSCNFYFSVFCHSLPCTFESQMYTNMVKLFT